MKQSEVVIQLANLASKGKYEVTPAGSQQMNALFEMVAKLINELEEAEKAAEGDDNDE